MSRRWNSLGKPRSRRLLIAAGAIVIALIMLEGCLRFLRFSEPSLFYVQDHERGMALRPLAEGWWHKEATNYVRINSAGFHDWEHEVSKPPGTLRIAILGDSYAEAMQVPLTEAFWAVAARTLQQCPRMNHQKIEILNFGVSDYSTAQELITLRSRVWDYSPDIVLLAFTNSDVPRNFRPLISDPLRPYFFYRNGQLVLDRSQNTSESSWSARLRDSSFGPSLEWLRRQVRILQLLTSVRRALLTPAQPQPGLQNQDPAREMSRSATPSAEQKSTSNIAPANNNSIGIQYDASAVRNELGLEGMVYLEPVDENWREAWRITEGLIGQMKEEVEDHGARFYVVTLSSEGQVTPDEETYQHLLSAAGLPDLFYPDRRIAALGAQDRFPVLNLATLLRDYAKKTNIFLHGFDNRLGSGHWNKDGHRVAGELIGNWLCSEASK